MSARIYFRYAPILPKWDPAPVSYSYEPPRLVLFTSYSVQFAPFSLFSSKVLLMDTKIVFGNDRKVPSPRYYFFLHHATDYCGLEHRRGKWGAGGQLLPLEMFWPPLEDFCPPQTFPYLGQELKIFLLLILGQKHSESGKDVFLFLENAEFWAKKTLLIRLRPFFRERWFLGQKAIQFQRSCLPS